MFHRVETDKVVLNADLEQVAATATTQLEQLRQADAN
jgi:hypothetical protein